MNLIFTISCFLVFANLCALAYRDVKDYILPDLLNINLALLFVTLHISSNWAFSTPTTIIVGGVVGGGFLLLIKIFADRFYKQDSLGLGDVKMVVAAGLGLGFPDIFMALAIGSLFGVAHGFFLSHKNKTPLNDTQVPAGVGLTIGIIIMFLFKGAQCL